MSAQQSKLATYTFAMLVAIFMVIFSFDCQIDVGFRAQGGETAISIAPKDPPPLGLLLPGMSLIGLALGINIDPSALAEILRRK